MDDEFAKLVRRVNPPRVVVDNDSCKDATVIQRFEEYPGIVPSLKETLGVMHTEAYTSFELTGTDRPGLLSEVCAVLTDLHCNVVNAEVWTHNTRAAAVVHVTDDSTGSAIDNPSRLSTIKELLCNVLKGDNDLIAAKTTVSPPGVTNRDRRLHQIMFADRDYERIGRVGHVEMRDKGSRPHITVLDCAEKDYTIITMRSKDRPKLLFDIICTLTDMQYVIFHGMVNTGRMEAYQEFYIRHVDGFPINSEAERERVKQCLEAGIERRASEGLELELCTEDRKGLLSEITRVFRENGLCIKRAEISTEGGKAKDLFYVTDVSGTPVDPEIIDSIQRQVGHTILKVKGNLSHSPNTPQGTTIGFLFGNIFKIRSLQNFKVIGSY